MIHVCITIYIIYSNMASRQCALHWPSSTSSSNRRHMSPGFKSELCFESQLSEIAEVAVTFPLHPGCKWICSCIF